MFYVFFPVLAMLAKKESNLDRRYLRQIYLDQHKDEFKWAHKTGMPGFIGKSLLIRDCVLDSLYKIR